MTLARALLAIVAGSAAFMVSACRFDDEANKARGCEGCAPGMCVFNYCLQAGDSDDGASGNGGGGDQNGTGGMGSVGVAGSGEPTGPCVPDTVCYLGPAETRGQGICTDGKAKCDAAGVLTCDGQTVPAEESCNKLDDDCDGNVDETLSLGSCAGQGSGACGSGVLTCEDGKPVCKAGAGEPTTETCNGLDDDCDGEVDNDSDEFCYPDDANGCDRNGDGTYDCVGVCAAGMRVCADGKLSACTGFVQPSEELCAQEIAQDDDCNGQVDDACPCAGPDSHPCFPGPGTAGIGRCRSGTQECVDGVLGECRGAIVARAETCDNQGTNDDCDLLLDDVPGTGIVCIGSLPGSCLLGIYQCDDDGEIVCVTAEPANDPALNETTCDLADDDCDGTVDDGFAFQTDEAHCGTCTTVCSGTGALCCAGGCVALADQDTNLHCGGCNPCATGQSCCDGQCVPSNGTAACNGCCGAGEGCCTNGSCVTLGTETDCASCGNACAGAALCCAGGCVAVADQNTTLHCGGCAGCDAGKMCCAGECRAGDCTVCAAPCVSPQICCMTACVMPAVGGACPSL